MQSNETTSTSVALARIFWMVGGPFILLLLAAQTVLSGPGWFTPWDAVFGLTLVAMILTRQHEFRAGDPQKSDGSPANIDDLRRYRFQVIGIGVAMWVIANVLGNHVLHHA